MNPVRSAFSGVGTSTDGLPGLWRPLLDPDRSIQYDGTMVHGPTFKLFPWKILLVIAIGSIFFRMVPFTSASPTQESVKIPAPLFLNGERLIYDIGWAGFRVGEGVLEVSVGEPLDNREVLYITSTARSNKFISWFFPVKDRIESVVDLKGLYPYRITMDQQHGRRKKYRQILFDQDNHTAVTTYKGKVTEFEIPPQVQDTLSSLYYFRAMPELETGSSVFIDVHEGKKNWRLELRILGRETLDTVMGTIPTVKVKAILLFEGILMNKGNLTIWVTDDNKRIPVRMVGKVKIGSVTASLIQVEPDRITLGR